MRRRLLAFAIVSLCAAKLAVVTLWALSLYRYDHVSFRHGATTMAFVSSDGGMAVMLHRAFLDPPADTPEGWHWSSLPPVGRGGLGLVPLYRVPTVLGVGGTNEAFNLVGGQSTLVAPHWFVLLLLAIPSLLLARHTLRDGVATRRRAAGRCIACGYDLRGGAPDATHCPECGVAHALSSVSTDPAS